MSWLFALRSEFSGFTRSERLFFLFAILTGFLIASEYGITRPASNAIFLTAFSAEAFPWVWLATVPLNLAAVTLYNRFLPLFGPLRMLSTISLAAICINLFCAFALPIFPKLAFFHFAWKDIYVLLMFKQLWSLIHSTIAAPRAKYLYGLIFGMGTVGSVAGSAIPGFLASRLGSEKLFFFTLPLYLLLIIAYRSAFRLSALKDTSFREDLSTELHPREGFALIRRNKFLGTVLLVVALMQISVGLVEYQFNAHLEINILDKDLRTEYCGRLNGLMNLLSAGFQFFGGFLMVQILGLKGSHLFIPVVLLGSTLFSATAATFSAISLSYAFLKSVDYSLFGIIREMLYIPLQLDEKYRAKAIIDVFVYRTSKALVSLAVLLLQSLVGSALLPFLGYSSIAIFIAWIFVVLLFLRAIPSSTIPTVLKQE